MIPEQGLTSTAAEFNVSPIIGAPEQPFEVDTSSNSIPPAASGPTLENRSAMVKYGLGDLLKKTKDEIYADLAQGKELDLRYETAALIDERKNAALETLLTKTAENKKGPLTAEETSGLATIVSGMTQQTDPQIVFEQAYGKQFMGSLDRVAQANSDSVLNEAKQKHPEETAQIMNEHAGLVTQQAILNTYIEDIQDEVKSQGYISWGYDQVKSMIPGYTDVQMRGLVPGVGTFTGITLGRNLEAQRQALLHLPNDQLLPALKAIVEPLRVRNPGLALDFVRSMKAQAAESIIMKDITLPIDVAGLGIGKATVSGVRKALATEGKVLKDVEKAAKDVAIAATDPKASKSTIEAAAGDLKQSAITRVTTNATAEAAGNPRATERGLESMMGVHRTDIADMKQNPGRYGMDLVNRFEEQTNSLVGDVLGVAKNVSKVEGLPDVMSNEVAVRAIWDNMKYTYKGLKNTIIDIPQPYKEQFTGKYFMDFVLGNADGTYFTKREVAENAKQFYGFGDAQILEGTNKANTKAAKKLAQLEKNVRDYEDTIQRIEKRQADDKYKTPEKKAKDLETLEFLRNEALPKVKNQIGGAQAQKATVEQQGLGYYIKVSKPINETDDVVRDFIAQTNNTQIPNNTISSFFNAWGVGHYRTPEDTLSKADRANRLITTYAPSEIFEVLKKSTPTIEKMAGSFSAAMPNRFSKSRQKWDEFQRVLLNGQELYDAATKQKGYFFKSPGELEEAYLSWFKRLPDADETTAYFEFKRAMEIDRAFRNIAEHRNQTRVGAETHKFTAVKDDGTGVSSPEFSGVNRKHIGGSTDNIAVIGERYGHEKVFSLASKSVQEKAEMQALIDSGEWKLIEVYNPEVRPLKGFGNITDQRVRFVMAKTVETKELDWNHVPRRGGGHVEYDYNYYIKQAKVKEDSASGHVWYEGDTTIMPIQINKMGQDVAKHLDFVRKLLKDKKDVAAQEYSNKNLHIEWGTVESWFKGEKDAAGAWHGARLSLNEPIMVVPRNKGIVQLDNDMEKRYTSQGKVFRDGTKEGSLARQNRVEFTEERDSHDIFTLDNKGTARDPLYNIAQAERVDPITSLNRGLTRIAKSNFMDDYKTMSVEHWIQQAKRYLNASEAELRHSPFYWFDEAKFLPGTDPITKGQLETARLHIKQLIGQPSETAMKLHAVSQKMADAAYTKLGPDSILTPEWDLGKLRDPFAFIRSVVYHAKMGLWNIPQFIVQAGNYSNILGIAGGKYATPGTLGAQLHFWSRANSRPEIVNYLDKMASKMYIPGASRWKPGEFKEAFEEFKKTGFGNVGGEYAALDDFSTNKIVGSGLDKFVDSSTFFVRNGERNSRYGAWYTAFKEFRDKKPTGRITDQDRSDILQRADTLNINMSRASSSALHTGAMSIPTQFYTYQIRLTELFASNRLTPKEKLRMFVTNSALYGIPMGLGISGIPFSSNVREKAMENGYVLGDNFFSGVAMEGLLSAVGAVITGGGDPKAGTWYDFGERFGTKGFEFIGGINRSDKNFIDIITGPAGSLVGGVISQADGFWRVVMNMMPWEHELFPPKAEDFIDPLKEISTVNNWSGVLAAINTGRYVSKNENWLADTTPIQATIKALLSIKDQDINDIQTFRNANKHQKEYQELIEKKFLQEYRRAILAADKNDEQGSKDYFTRAKRFLDIGGYPEDRYNSLLEKAARENKSVLDRVTFDFYRRRPNDEQKDIGMDALTRRENVKKKKAGEE